MVDFIGYVVSELKSKRLSKENALALVSQFSRRSAGRGSSIHPLLHTNTSDFGQQSYRTVLTGEEFFLRDHQVRLEGAKVARVLPGVAYLEMVRAAVWHASSVQRSPGALQLHDVVWLKPLVVEDSTDLSIDLLENDTDQSGPYTMDYEIYRETEGERHVFCQGRATLRSESATGWLDLAQIERQIGQDRLEAARLYGTCATMGLHYGPAHQSITSINLAPDQLLARLRLPEIVAETSDRYLLHPSLMDGALQASIGLVIDLNRVPDRPSVPFALDSLIVSAPCTRDMLAWVRYSAGSGVRDRVMRLDVDLCDESGNVCVQIRGFASRSLAPGRMAFDDDFYRNILEKVLRQEISIDEAADSE